MRDSKQQIPNTLFDSSNVFEVRGLTEDVYADGIYRVDFDLHHSYKWSLERKVQDLFYRHELEVMNTKNNIQFRNSAKKITTQLKIEYAEFFI